MLKPLLHSVQMNFFGRWSAAALAARFFAASVSRNRFWNVRMFCRSAMEGVGFEFLELALARHPFKPVVPFVEFGAVSVRHSVPLGRLAPPPLIGEKLTVLPSKPP